MMIRLAIAEQHAIVRWALSEAFAKVADVEVVGTAGNVNDTLDLIGRTRPDVLLFDLPVADLKDICDFDHGPIVLVLADQSDPPYGARALAAGAHGFVSKAVEPIELFEAIRAVSRGERVVPPGVEALLAAGDHHPASTLTKRELQVMEMIARGMTNREIAHDLQISVKTIDTHRSHVLKKLVLRNNAELTRFAVRHGYLTA